MSLYPEYTVFMFLVKLHVFLIVRSVIPGSLLIDCSTIDPAVAKLVSEKASEKSATYLDAPVSGGWGDFIILTEI